VLAQPQVNSDKVVVQTTSGEVIALSRQTGEQLWVYDAQEPALTLRGTGTPLLLRDGVLAGFANGKVVALALDTGSAVWDVRVSESKGRSELERLVDIDGRFLVAGDLVYTGGYQGRLVAINPAAAAIVWSRDFSTYRSLAAGFGNVYAVDAAGAVEAFDASSAASVWRNDNFSYRKLGSPVALGNDLVVGDAYGYLHVLSQADGHLVARYQIDNSPIYAEPVVINDTLLVLSNSGKLEALRLK
jgi:outer membrane protein assembly factor BamB